MSDEPRPVQEDPWNAAPFPRRDGRPSDSPPAQAQGDAPAVPPFEAASRDEIEDAVAAESAPEPGASSSFDTGGAARRDDDAAAPSWALGGTQAVPGADGGHDEASAQVIASAAQGAVDELAPQLVPAGADPSNESDPPPAERGPERADDAEGPGASPADGADGGRGTEAADAVDPGAAEAGAGDSVSGESPAQRARADLEALRAVLVGPEQAGLRALSRRVVDPIERARDVAEALPAAVSLRTQRDEALARALAPTVESALRTSVQRDPQHLVDAIFPVMGPAIRKAISETLARMLQSLSQALEYGFSLRGWQWRMEAWRTGKSFAEVVLLKTLQFKVEQVFLIHRETGLVLQHLTAESVQGHDADAVAGMLTALQDFVRDSFNAAKGEGLETVKVGSKLVWIEAGPRAVLAAVVAGTPREDLRATLQDALGQVHLHLADPLAGFSGDTRPFAAAQRFLEPCLVQAARADVARRRISPATWVIVALLLLTLVVWGVMRYRAMARWDGFVEALRAQPGVVVAYAGRLEGRRAVVGLRDPLAVDVGALLEAHKLDAGQVLLRLEPYAAMDPLFILRRAEPIMRPPATVKMSMSGSVLVLEGEADHAWIAAARRNVAQIAGVSALRESKLVDRDLLRLESLRREIEATPVRFVFAQTNFAPGQEAVVGRLADKLAQVFAIAGPAGIEALVQVVGHTDGTGAEERNVRLSRDRADRLVTQLVARGVPARAIASVGVGSTQPVAREDNDESREKNRYASVRLVFQEAPLKVDLSATAQPPPLELEEQVSGSLIGPARARLPEGAAAPARGTVGGGGSGGGGR